MKYGFIGCGNMGGAIARALVKSTQEILLSDPSEKAQLLAGELECQTTDNFTIAQKCDRIVLAVKPQILESVLTPLKSILSEKRPVIITMAAGIEIKRIEEIIGVSLPIIRIMPNTPVSVGKGMILYCYNSFVDQDTVTDFLTDMQYAGRLDCLEEKLIDAASALSGSGPAYMYVFLEALADAAVACGLPRQSAITYAATTMEGAAKMLLESNQHPGVLKDAVCSPGGSTIEGIKTLEENGFRGAVIDCVISAFKKNKELGN